MTHDPMIHPPSPHPTPNIESVTGESRPCPACARTVVELLCPDGSRLWRHMSGSVSCGSPTHAGTAEG